MSVWLPCHNKGNVLIGKQKFQLPKFMPSLSYSSLQSSISISICTQHVNRTYQLTPLLQTLCHHQFPHWSYLYNVYVLLQPLQTKDLLTLIVLPFIPLWFLCTRFWQLVHWVNSLFGLVFRWVWRLSGKLNLNANFSTESKVRLAQLKLLLKMDCLLCFSWHPLAAVSSDCIPSLADELQPRTNGPQAQYLPPNRSQFVFYSVHTVDYRHVCLQTKLRKNWRKFSLSES